MNLLQSKIFISTLCLLFGLGVGFLYFGNNHKCDVSNFKYINLKLACEDRFVIKKNSYSQLKIKLGEIIKEKKDEGKIVDVSVYFRDLQDGPTLGINEHALFSPASLLKLPLLLTYYNLRTENPDLFNRRIQAKKINQVSIQSIEPRKSIKEGETYSIKELLDYMIIYSDNNSYGLLLDYLANISPNSDALKQTFVDLGIIDPKDFLDNTISVKSYGSIFVQLYNSSYFNKKEISEEIIQSLISVDWKDGLNAGVPSNIEIAHKFGERSGFSGNLKQLHDCGIIYYPSNPYLLCVMTRGEDFYELSKTIALISKMFYEEITDRAL